MSLISDYHGKRTRSRAMGLHQTSVYVGTIGGGFFAGLIGQHYGWRWSFILFGWLVGAGTAPVTIGWIAQKESLSFAISIGAVAYLAAAVLLLSAALFTAKRDAARAEALRVGVADRPGRPLTVPRSSPR